MEMRVEVGMEQFEQQTLRETEIELEMGAKARIETVTGQRQRCKWKYTGIMQVEEETNKQADRQTDRLTN